MNSAPRQSSTTPCADAAAKPKADALGHTTTCYPRNHDRPTHPPRLLRDLGSGPGPARLGPGARRDAPTMRLPAVVIGVAHSWPASRRAPCEGRLERGFAQLEVAVPSSPEISPYDEEETGGRDHRDGSAQALGHDRGHR